MCVCVCVFVCDCVTRRVCVFVVERESVKASVFVWCHFCDDVSVCLCDYARWRERERVFECVCVCVEGGQTCEWCTGSHELCVVQRVRGLA